MKLFFGEFPADYRRYNFPYQVWLLKEEEDRLDAIYGNGFLPVRSLPGVFYLSRNLRVDLNKFELSSENRRILKKTANIKAELFPLADFPYAPEVQKFCKDYADKKLGPGLFPAAGIKAIFKNKVFNHVFVFRETSSQNPVGYAVCNNTDSLLQYAYAFYDFNRFPENLGARMMLEAVSWAKANQKSYVYLGTGYEKSALYKTEYKGVEFFNGFKWSDNLAELKVLIERQTNKYLLRDDEYLKTFYQGDLVEVLNKYGVRVNF